jgi:filamentous hemagglutinin family protein
MDFAMMHSWPNLRVGVGGCLLLYLQFSAGSVAAQIVGDGTLSTQVNRGGQIFEITGGVQRGNNLFHSFDIFSVPTDSVANFQLPRGLVIENIISRVTGTSISNINGTIQAGGSANLFLINPNGIIFGPNSKYQWFFFGQYCQQFNVC